MDVIDAVQAWLELVDRQKGTESWEETADYFKSTTPRRTWQEFMSTRKKLGGTMLSREFIYQEETTSIPDAPDGEYVAFTSLRDRLPQIYTMKLDGSELVNVSSHSVHDMQPAWDPRGGNLLFTGIRGAFSPRLRMAEHLTPIPPHPM